MFRIAAALSISALVCMGAGQPAGKPAQQPALPSGHPSVPGATQEEWPKAKAEDVSSVEAIMKAYYASTSGAKGQPRDWERFRSLFTPNGRLIAARPGPDGGSAVMMLSVDEYVKVNRKYFEGGGFFDKEIAQRVESFGSVTQVWSTYESRHAEADPEPYVRGIASVQLLKDAGRWWIVNVFWDFERADNPVPAKYLESPKD